VERRSLLKVNCGDASPFIWAGVSRDPFLSLSAGGAAEFEQFRAVYCMTKKMV
jgi:hypothetical protein